MAAQPPSLKELFLAALAVWKREAVQHPHAMLNRLATGHWNVPSPAGLNAEAAALGPTYNVFTGATNVAPAFISYTPARYLRPFDLPPALPFF